MLVIVAALRRELAGIERLLELQQRTRLGEARVAEGRVSGIGVALVHSGIGKIRSEAATEAAIEKYQPKAMLAVGFSGGLAKEVRGGDLSVPEWLEAEGLPALRPDPELRDASLRAMEEESLPLRAGSLVSMPMVMPGPEEKARLAAAYPRALMVDMESYWVGSAAQAAGVPFLAVRTASDGAGERLPDYEAFLDEMGEVRPLHAAWYYLRRPWHLSAAPGLAANARQGTKNLAAFAGVFLRRVEQGVGAR